MRPTTISRILHKLTDNLSLNYGYYDQDGDTEDGTIISWYRAGTEDPVVTGTVVPGDQSAKVLSSSNTSKGEQWYATVQPKDGQDPGEIYTSNTVTILNSAPIHRIDTVNNPGFS
ncbi:MAG: hypothetical protein U5N58_05295 [Actinomycetota bacterium]|nr:hypothetical protein [Actinomycetota bacterium]